MPRQRLELLSKEAVARGATVVSNYREATHIIISTLIKSLEIVAKYLGETKENLEEYLKLVRKRKEIIFDNRVDAETPTLL